MKATNKSHARINLLNFCARKSSKGTSVCHVCTKNVHLSRSSAPTARRSARHGPDLKQLEASGALALFAAGWDAISHAACLFAANDVLM